jgi:hypothetical protein
MPTSSADFVEVSQPCVSGCFKLSKMSRVCLDLRVMLCTERYTFILEKHHSIQVSNYEIARDQES